MKVEEISLSKISHLDSLWKRDWGNPEWPIRRRVFHTEKGEICFPNLKFAKFAWVFLSLPTVFEQRLKRDRHGGIILFLYFYDKKLAQTLWRFAIWRKCNIKFRYFRFWATLSRHGISVYLFFLSQFATKTSIWPYLLNIRPHLENRNLESWKHSQGILWTLLMLRKAEHKSLLSVMELSQSFTCSWTHSLDHNSEVGSLRRQSTGSIFRRMRIPFHRVLPLLKHWIQFLQTAMELAMGQIRWWALGKNIVVVNVIIIIH